MCLNDIISTQYCPLNSNNRVGSFYHRGEFGLVLPVLPYKQIRELTLTKPTKQTRAFYYPHHGQTRVVIREKIYLIGLLLVETERCRFSNRPGKKTQGKLLLPFSVPQFKQNDLIRMENTKLGCILQNPSLPQVY